MMSPMTPDRATLWNRMRLLLERLVPSLERETCLEDSLDYLNEVLGADSAAIALRGEGNSGVDVVVGRRRRRSLSPAEHEGLSAAVVQAALARGSAIVAHADADHADLLAPGVRAALAAPLRGPVRGGFASRPGAVYVDFRARDARLHASQVEFFDAVALLLSGVLHQGQRLEVAKETLREAHIRRTSETPEPALDELLGYPSMGQLRNEVRACLRSDSSLMIMGESGTGKTRLAATIAQASGRQPVVRATLGVSDDLNTITSELFGHERGAFTGAVTRRRGLVEYADGGTLILDEILNLPPHAQQLLLDLTQFGNYRPLGYQGREPKEADVRIIAVTNGDIAQAIRDTRFRHDLYFRLAQVPIVMPPLRERRDDIPKIADSYFGRIDVVRPWRLSAEAERLLVSPRLGWPGNIRQLEAVLKRAMDRALVEGSSSYELDPRHFADLGVTVPTPMPARELDDGAIRSVGVTENMPLDAHWELLLKDRRTLEEIERDLIDRALRESQGVVAKAARQLKVSRTSLISRMNTLGLRLAEYREAR